MKQGYIVLYNVVGFSANYCSPIDIDVDIETVDTTVILTKLLDEVCLMHFNNSGDRITYNQVTLVGITKVYEKDNKLIITNIHG